MNGGVMFSQRRFDPNNPNNGPLAASSLKIATVTWAELQALDAAASVGRIFRVSDVGIGGGGYFVSDGTYWRSLNGHCTLAAENLSAITTTQLAPGGTSAAIPGWTLAIPDGLFARPGTMLRGMVRAHLEGTVGSGGGPQADIRADFGAGALSDKNLCRTPVLSSASPFGQGLGLMTRIDSTSIEFVQSSATSAWSGLYSGNGLQTGLATGAFNLYLTGGISTTPGAGELLRFTNVLVELLG